MLSIVQRAALRAKRAVQRKHPRSIVEVERIVRTTPSSWVATVRMTHGLNEWTERVTFKRAFTREGYLITITDKDYPADRIRRILVDGKRDMPSLITEYIIAGRW